MEQVGMRVDTNVGWEEYGTSGVRVDTNVGWEEYGTSGVRVDTNVGAGLVWVRD